MIKSKKGLRLKRMWRSDSKEKHKSFSHLLQTQRLVLRPATMLDFDEWRTVRAINQNFLQPYEPTWPRNALSDVFFKRRVERLSKDWAEDKTYAFLIFHEDGLIGGINLNNVARGAAQYASLGYWLDELSQGHGYMGEAAGAVLSYAFDTLGLFRVNAATLPHNMRSRRMLERLGFTEEGFARGYIQINGERADHILYGLNRADFSGASGHTG